MALKSIIDKSTYNGLSDELKKEYKADGDDYVLDITELDKHPQAGALKRAKDRVSQERDELKTEFNEFKKQQETARKQYEADLRALREGKGDNADDIAKVRAEYEKKLGKQRNEYEQKVQGLNTDLQNVMIGDKAQALAESWSKTPSLMKSHIASRLTTERNTEGRLELRVLDKDGQPSAMSLEDLKSEFTSNKEFAPVMKVNGASGTPGRGERNSGSAHHKPNGGDGASGEITSLDQAKTPAQVAQYRAYKRSLEAES